MDNKNLCEMTVDCDKVFGTYCRCGKPAKYISPPEGKTKRQLYLCGIHKNSVDKMYKRINKKDRCQAIHKAMKGEL